MAGNIDQFDQRLKQANTRMAELRELFDLAEKQANEFGMAIKASTDRLDEMLTRRSRLRDLIKEEGQTPEDKRKYRREARALDSGIESQRGAIGQLTEAQQAMLAAPKGAESATKAIETLKANYAALSKELEVYKKLQSGGWETADTQAAMDILTKKIEGQTRAVSLQIAQLEKYAAALERVGVVSKQTSKGGGVFGEGDQTFPGVTPQPEPKKLTKAEIREQERLKELENLRQQYESQSVFAKSRQLADSYKFKTSDLERVRFTPTTGVRELTYTKKGEMGELENLKMYIDRAGNILPNTSRQFNTFASSVARDVVELTKWTIAIGLIYGPMRKFQEMMEKLVQNEALLANAMVVLSGSSTEVETVFKTVASAANLMGEDVGGAIDVFTQAYRATGDLGDQYQRISVATQLMADGMTLAKLSGMQYNEAIDNLVGSLKQAGIPLNEGRQLLDKWVKTSTIANVDIRTLAIGFSVLGESASAAGLSVDQLNGLLAVISENMGTSGAEAANAARAIVSGFESSKAIDAMNLLGISVRDLEGETRPLLEVMTQIQNMKLQGLISPSQYAQLTLAIGGGTRRQAVVAATIEDTAKINKIAAEGANASGAAQEALGRKLDTVQTAATRLNNAFQSLAQTLGDSGGILDLFKVTLNFLNLIVRAVDSLAGALGKAGPLLTTLLLTKGLVKMRPDLGTSAIDMASGFGNTLFGVSRSRTYNSETGAWEPVGRGDQFVKRVRAITVSRGGEESWQAAAGRGARIGMAMSIIPALLNLSSGNTKGALADVGGGIAGAIAGTLTGLGPVMGSVIGQAIAEAFVKSTETSLDLEKYKFGNLPGEADTTPDTNEEEIRKAISILEESQNFFLMNTIKSIWSGIGGILFPKAGITKESVTYSMATEEQRERYAVEIAKLREQGIVPQEAGYVTKAQRLQTEAAAEAAPFSTGMRKTRALELGVELNLGKIKPTDYSNMVQQIKAFETVAAGWESTLGQAFREQNKDIKTLEESYQRYLDVMTYGSQEQIEAVNSVSNEIGEIINQLDYLKSLPPTSIEVRTISGEEIEKTAGQWIRYYTDKLQETLDYGANLLTGVSVSAQLERQPVPSLFNQGETITGTLEQVREWLVRAAAENVQYIKQSTVSDQRPEGYTSEEVEAVRASYENVAIGIEEGGQLIYRSLLELLEYLNLPKELIGTDWLKKVLDEMIAAGQITVEIEAKEPNLQQPGIPQSMEQTLKAWVEYFETMMRSYGITAEEEAQVVIWEGGQWSTMMANDKAFQLALQKIQETEQKQLEQGMWNVPEGATIWVPITSLTPANQPYGGEGGGWNVEPPPEPIYGPYGPEGPEIPAPEDLGPSGTPTDPIYVSSVDTMRTLAGGLKMGGSAADKWENDWKFRLKNEPPPGVTTQEGYVAPKPAGKSAIWRLFQGENIFDILKESYTKIFGGGDLDRIGGTSGMGATGAGAVGALTPLLSSLSTILRGISPIGGNVRTAMKEDTTAVPNMPKMSLSLNNTTTLTVDGRVLARSIKPYLIADINRAVSALGRNITTQA